MKMSPVRWMLLGDILVLALVTFFGFASHNELGTAGLRMLSTFIPLVIGWLIIAPYLGVYKPAIIRDPRQLWRPFWAMILSAPMVAWIRGVWLQTPILPIFVVILGGISALALLVWRIICWFILSRSG
jgi:hypothetical protein